MKFHKEGKGTLLTVLLAIIIISGVSIYFLEMWSLLIIIPLLVLYGFVMWFFRNPEREIDKNAGKNFKQQEVKLFGMEYNMHPQKVI